MNAVNVFLVGLLYMYISIEAYHRNTAELNVRKCKLTHSGIEYRGTVFTTKFKSLCRPWNTTGTETDSSFADGSRVSAKNYCRNPKGVREDLWCYTYNDNSPVESCAVPLCYSKKCRVTGPGVEYGGNVNVTKSGYGCLRWTNIFSDLKFPDGGRIAVGNRCRNPTGDSGGPWCFTSVDGTTVPDYCETSGCDDNVCGWSLVNGSRSGEFSAHGHYTEIRGGGDGSFEMIFELKAWNPAAVRNDGKSFRILLTAYPIGFGPPEDGFEVSVPVETFSRSVAITRMDLSWRDGFIVLNAGRSSTEVLSYELNTTITPVTYVSYVGSEDSLVAIRFPYCDQTEAGREEHVTTNQNAFRIFPLKKTITSSSELSFSVRAVISASVTYFTAPTKQTPRLIMVFEARPLQQIKIIYQDQSTSDEQLIFHQTYDMDVMSYWKWHQYIITIIDKTLQIQIVKNDLQNKTITMLKISDYKLRFFHWFAIGSKAIAHWTLYFSGPEYYPLAEATFPECVMSESGENYRGTQWITGDGEQCVPWNVPSVRKLVKENTLIDKNFTEAKNYCRNPTGDPYGPYCFVAVGDGISSVQKRSCNVRKCLNTRCSVAGIASDYLGTLDKTVSNRTCLKWSKAMGMFGGKGYVFPDGSSSAAKNYCRNPTKEPTGTWCYVDDGVTADLCDVPGCSDDENSETLLTSGDGVHWVYVFPEWRTMPPGLRIELKRWTPGVFVGVSLRFRRASDPSSYDLLQVGADRDEKIKLFRVRDIADEKGTAAVIDQLVYPHIAMATRWTELTFGFNDDTVAMSSAAGGQIFHWAATSNDSGSHIAFIGLSTVDDEGYVGLRFPTENCLVHSSESEKFSVYLPMNVRTNASLTNAKHEIVFRMRQIKQGTIRIALIKRTFGERYVLEIKDSRAVLLYEERQPKVFEKYESKTGDIVTVGAWTRIQLSWTESVLRLNHSKGGCQWTIDQPLLVRYFSVANRGGRTAWTANCDEPWRPPPDLDRRPRDGGWSEWGPWERCTKTCGGGTGVRSRRCDRPSPNMSGRPCVGPDTLVENCNEHDCGQVSAKTMATIRRILASESHNVVATTGDTLTMSYDRQTVEIVKIESPRAQFGWQHNGKTVFSPSTDKTDTCTIIINSCTIRNSGVYTFFVQPPESERIVLKLIAVSINDKPISVYIKDTVRVHCNAATLGYLFQGLLQEWVVNDSYVIKNYGVNALASIDVDTITIDNIHFQGVWKCIVKSTEINRTWITNIMEIRVIGVSTIWTQIMQDPIIKIIFWNNSSPKIFVFICTILILGLCIGTFVCVCVLNRWRKQMTKKNNKTQEHFFINN